MTVGIVRMLWPILRMQANCLHAFLADATALQVVVAPNQLHVCSWYPAPRTASLPYVLLAGRFAAITNYRSHNLGCVLFGLWTAHRLKAPPPSFHQEIPCFCFVAENLPM